MNLQRIFASAGAIVAGVVLAVLVVGGGSNDATPRQIDVAPRAAVEEPAAPVAVPAADVTTSTVAPAVTGPGPIAATPKPTEATVAPQPTATTTCHLSSIPTLANGQPAGPPTMICG